MGTRTITRPTVSSPKSEAKVETVSPPEIETIPLPAVEAVVVPAPTPVVVATPIMEPTVTVVEPQVIIEEKRPQITVIEPFVPIPVQPVIEVPADVGSPLKGDSTPIAIAMVPEYTPEELQKASQTLESTLEPKEPEEVKTFENTVLLRKEFYPPIPMKFWERA